MDISEYAININDFEYRNLKKLNNIETLILNFIFTKIIDLITKSKEYIKRTRKQGNKFKSLQ